MSPAASSLPFLSCSLLFTIPPLPLLVPYHCATPPPQPTSAFSAIVFFSASPVTHTHSHTHTHTDTHTHTQRHTHSATSDTHPRLSPSPPPPHTHTHTLSFFFHPSFRSLTGTVFVSR